MVTIVWHTTVTTTAWLRSATTLAVVALLVVIGAELSGPASRSGPDSHGAHVLAAAPGVAAVVSLDHPHAQRTASVAAPEAFAAAVVPRPTTILAVFAVAIAVIAAWLSATSTAAATQRGPPQPVGANLLSGWRLLVRFCIDRR